MASVVDAKAKCFKVKNTQVFMQGKGAKSLFFKLGAKRMLIQFLSIHAKIDNI